MKELPTFDTAGSAGDPNRASLVVGSVLVVAGVVTLVVTWRLIGGQSEAWKQLPYLVSGGFGGIGTVAVGLVVVNVQATRRLNALRRMRMDVVIDTAADVAHRLRDEDGSD